MTAYGVKPTQHHHRQNHITIFAPNVQVSENVIRDPPNEIGYPPQIAVAHTIPSVRIHVLVLVSMDLAVYIIRPLPSQLCRFIQ
jgi:hypothetical protein